MKRVSFVVFVILTVFLTVSGASACGSEAGKGHFGAMGARMAVMQSMFALNAEEVLIMEDIFNSNKHATREIARSHGLTRDDLKIMRTMQGKFKQLRLESLAKFLNEEQLQTLRKEIFADFPFTFIELGETEKQEFLQNALGVSEEEASQVISSMVEVKTRREIVMENLGFDIERIGAFREDMKKQRNEMKERLGTVLSNDQIVQFNEFRSRMAAKKRGQDHP